MAAAEEEVETVIYRFYSALDDLLQAKGTQAMSDIWHHADYVSTSHPFGHWARGWAEVWATWEEGAAVFACYKGHVGRTDTIGGIHDLRVSMMGEAAFGTSVYKSRLYMSDGPLDLRVNCTNIVHRVGGAWKLVHHHAEQAPPAWQAAIGRMVQAGHG
jgi:ketosteroid isomerase-like protein